MVSLDITRKKFPSKRGHSDGCRLVKRSISAAKLELRLLLTGFAPNRSHHKTDITRKTCQREFIHIPGLTYEGSMNQTKSSLPHADPTAFNRLRVRSVMKKQGSTAEASALNISTYAHIHAYTCIYTHTYAYTRIYTHIYASTRLRALELHQKQCKTAGILHAKGSMNLRLPLLPSFPCPPCSLTLRLSLTLVLMNFSSLEACYP